MITAWIIYLLWLCAIFVLNIYTGSNIALILLIFSVLFPLVSMLLYKIGSVKLKIDSDFPLNCQKGCTVSGNITVSNKSFLSYSKIKFNVEYKNLLTNETAILTLFSPLNIKETATFQIRLKNNYCGTIKITNAKIRIYDLFCLTYKEKEFSLNLKIVVLPEVFSINTQIGKSNFVNYENDEYSMYKSGYDMSDSFGYRDYIPGDNLKHINWKLTQKYGHTLVKEGGLPVEKSVLLILETILPPNTKSPPSSKLVSAMAEAFISLSQSLCESSITHKIAWFDKKEESVCCYNIDNGSDLSSVVSKLLSASFSIDDTSSISRFEKEINEDFAHIVCVTTQLYSSIPKSQSKYTFLLACNKQIAEKTYTDNSVQIYTFSPKTMSNDLYMIEI